MHRTSRIVTAFVATLAFSMSLTAQTSPRSVEWQQLRQLAQGKKASVKLQDGKSHRGRIAATSPSSLTLDSRSISCQEIHSVEIQAKSRRAAWAVAGGAAGLAAGVLLGVRFSNEGNDSAAAGLIAGLTGAGAALGYAAGGQGKTQLLTLAPGSCGR